MRNKHLTPDDRKVIEQSLNTGISFKAIGKLLDKDCTTIKNRILRYGFQRMYSSL